MGVKARGQIVMKKGKGQRAENGIHHDRSEKRAARQERVDRVGAQRCVGESSRDIRILVRERLGE